MGMVTTTGLITMVTITMVTTTGLLITTTTIITTTMITTTTMTTTTLQLLLSEVASFGHECVALPDSRQLSARFFGGCALHSLLAQWYRWRWPPRFLLPEFLAFISECGTFGTLLFCKSECVVPMRRK